MRKNKTNTNNEMIRISEAKKLAEEAGFKVSTPTLINWVKENEIGTQPSGEGGTWFVNKVKFLEMINAKIG